jgi:hypothetical protein
MIDSSQFNLDDLPYTGEECHNLRLKLLQGISKKEDKTLDTLCRKKSDYYRHQGSAYGLLLIGSYTIVSYVRFKNYKPHKFGLIIGSLFGYYGGAFVGTLYSLKYVVEEIGVIQEYPELNEIRAKILKKCKKY